MNSTPLILPRKFQIKPISDEPEQQRYLHLKLLLERMRIELLKLRANNHEPNQSNR